MMSFAEFNRRVRELATGRSCTAKVEASTYATHFEITWQAWVSESVRGRGWTDEHKTPEACLVEFGRLCRGEPEPDEPSVGIETVDPIADTAPPAAEQASADVAF